MSDALAVAIVTGLASVICAYADARLRSIESRLQRLEDDEKGDGADGYL